MQFNADAVTTDFVKELLGVIDAALTLLRQELITLRNESMQQKLNLERISLKLEEITESRNEERHSATAIKVAIITAFASLVVGLIQFFKNGG